MFSGQVGHLIAVDTRVGENFIKMSVGMGSASC